MSQPRFLLVDPEHFEVAYAINPWMEPVSWRADPERLRRAARDGFEGLAAALRRSGAGVEILRGAPGAPDLVFPANAGVVMDGRAVLARFRHPERRVEEPILKAAFETFLRRGLISELIELPEDLVQEGAGDFIWDRARRLFWAGHGQRSTEAGAEAVAAVFGQAMVKLELATPRFYHLDTCFCPLPGGEVLYYPPAFTPESLAAIEAHVAPEARLVASDEDAARFCVNAVAFGRTIVMARPAADLRQRLHARGYRLEEIDLEPFILSGGGAYCMTLRLDRTSSAAAEAPLAEIA